LQKLDAIEVFDGKDQKRAEAAMNSNRKLAETIPDQTDEEKSERRRQAERRRFSYSAYIPERRTGEKRRRATSAKKTLDDMTPQDGDE
jgi:hypothetical protein